MPSHRFFVEKIEEEVILSDEELRHLMVMRPQVRQEIELVDGQGNLAQAAIVAIAKRQAVLKVNHIAKVERPACPVILAQAMSQMNHLEWAVEKATELGAAAIWLFAGDLSDKKELSETQLKRLKHIAIAALKQSGNLYLPALVIKEKLHRWTKGRELLFYGDLDPHLPPLYTQLREVKAANEGLIFVIGPEKGLSKLELEALAKLGQGVCLHRHILRTETAAVLSLGLIEHWLLFERQLR